MTEKESTIRVHDLIRLFADHMITAEQWVPITPDEYPFRSLMNTLAAIIWPQDNDERILGKQALEWAINQLPPADDVLEYQAW